MITIGETAANVQPWTIGSRTPNRHTPTHWISVAMPHTSRSAVMRYARSAGDSFIAPPTISGTATAPAYMASTC